MSTHTQERTFLTVAEAADRLGVHPATVRRAIANGSLEAIQLRSHGAIRIPLAALTPQEPT